MRTIETENNIYQDKKLFKEVDNLPKVKSRVICKETKRVDIVESVNQQTEFVIVLKNGNERDSISFQELQAKYISTFTPS